MKRTLNIILIGDRAGSVRNFVIHPQRAALIALLTVMVLCGATLSGGYRLGVATEARRQLAEVTELRALSWQQQAEIASARESARANLDALALRLGRMQAQVVRLDALGALLVAQAELDATEFDFRNPPSLGGPGTPSALSATPVPDFIAMLNELDMSVDDRDVKLTVLERLLMKRSLRQRATPSGQAVEHGLTSSAFGKRIDPFTGKWGRHKGIDIAGKEGSDIMAVGDGVVIWSGDRQGYGKLVEIDHGNGYVTRYGHNKKLLVEPGDTVRKGQTIALMGSTGRSTGPHVHIEVVRNGIQVDPAEYLNK